VLLVVRAVCPPAAGPLEDYAACFDEFFSRLAQRRGFREYLTGLLAPRDRNKTLTGLAGAEPVEGAQHAAVQRLQYFLSQSTWDADEINRRRLELLVNDPATAPHTRGVIAIDDSGDRKDGTATAHVGRQWLGRYGKTDNGIVTVTTVWADERVYYPLHAEPYTPAARFPRKQADPEFRTKLQIAADLITQARSAGVICRAVVADSFYGDHDALRGHLSQSGLGFVMALKPARGTWQYGAEAYTPKDAARAVPWDGPDNPGGWHPVQRTFRDGHTETWWATDAQLGWWGPDGHTRLVIATTDPQTLPDKGHLVPGHESAPARWTARHPRRSAPAGRPDRGRAALRDPALDRAELQTGQGRTRLGRLPGPLRHRDPPPPNPGPLRVLVLLEHLVRPTIHKRHQERLRGTVRRRIRREGARQPTHRLNFPAGPKRYARSAPGSPRGYTCNAGGTHGPTHRHRLNSNNSSTPSNEVMPSTSTYPHKGDKLPLVLRV
jgi:hypothetical protein